MARYRALTLATKYWKPRTDYLREIVNAVNGKIIDGDFVVISEKAISTAKNNIIDEAALKPTFTARLFATTWMHIGWGYVFGIICGFGQRLLHRLRKYPAEAGSRHKQVALQRGGFLQALMFGSEGGIDGSNMPYSLVCLPLSHAYRHAETIRLRILLDTGKRVSVIIVDSDKAYTFKNFHFTPRPKPMEGIYSGGGVVAYVLGRALKFRRRPTPLALAGQRLLAEEALTISNVADRARGPGSGATVWDMAARFRVSATDVTWQMLDSIEHKPIVIVRRAVKNE
jgi:F420-0:gamma-glutamyl ligase-like protein